MVNNWPMITYDRQIQHHNCHPLENEGGFNTVYYVENHSQKCGTKNVKDQSVSSKESTSRMMNRGLEPSLPPLQWVTVTVFPFLHAMCPMQRISANSLKGYTCCRFLFQTPKPYTRLKCHFWHLFKCYYSQWWAFFVLNI